MKKFCGSVQQNKTACFACLHEPTHESAFHADCEGTGEAKKFCGSVNERLYVGLYDTSTRGCGSEGALPATDAVGYNKPSLYVYDVGSDGSLTKLSEVSAGLNVSWVTSGDKGQADSIYAVSEVCLYNKSKTGTVGAFKITKEGLNFINRIPTGGQGPVYAEPSPIIQGEKGARNLLVAMYPEGSVGVLTAEANGAISPGGPPTSQGEPGKTATHEARLLPVPTFVNGNSYALVPALALDKVSRLPVKKLFQIRTTTTITTLRVITITNFYLLPGGHLPLPGYWLSRTRLTESTTILAAAKWLRAEAHCVPP
jgi:hypothetical protein